MTDFEDRLRRDPEGAEILDLMLAENERELSEFEARRIERYVEQSPELQAYLEGRTPEVAGQDAMWDEVPVPLPTDAEWRAVDIAVHQGMAERGTPAVASDREEADRTTRFSAWQTVAALAATLLLAFFIVENYGGPDSTDSSGGVIAGSDEAEFEMPEDEVEIAEYPEDMTVEIDDVEGALMIYVTSG